METIIAPISIACSNPIQFEAEMIEVLLSNVQSYKKEVDNPRVIRCSFQKPIPYDNRGNLKVSKLLQVQELKIMVKGN